MKRDEYLKLRRLQGIDSQIRRLNHQIHRGNKQISNMRDTFSRKTEEHRSAVGKVEERLQGVRADIDALKKQKESISKSESSIPV